MINHALSGGNETMMRGATTPRSASDLPSMRVSARNRRAGCEERFGGGPRRAVCSYASLIVFLNLLPLFAPQSIHGQQPASGTLHNVFSGAAPSSADQLRAMQEQMQTVAARVIPATVAIQVGRAQGSGVIISADGYVLTAAHVIGDPNRRAIVILHDGRRVPGRTMGVYRTLDAGLLKLTGAPSDYGYDEWPHVEQGESADLKPGQWCLATGHPGGYETSPMPVLRSGRILSIDGNVSINTDCTLVGGDSGGPLFDLSGKLIGIHSRIGSSLTLNLHVPIGAFRESWERLEAGEAWGHLPGTAQPYLGVQGVVDSDVAKIANVFDNTPAAEAGIRVGDIIVRFAGSRVTSFRSLQELVASQTPGKKVTVELLRDGTRLTLEVTLGAREAS